MWSQLSLCLLVGLAYASQNPAWKENSVYVYDVRARSVAGLDQLSNDYTGIIFKAKLQVLPRSDGNLDAVILQPQYAQIHAKLRDGWESEIPDSELNYQQLPISSKPFQLVVYEGALRNLIVDGDIPNWEANIIKSIASQFQLDTKGANIISSHYNIRTQDDLNSAVFKTMEETVTGVSETLYEIHPLPEYVLQSTPWLVPLKRLQEEGESPIEVIKSKNFTHSPTYYLPSYHFGLEGIEGYEPANQMAQFSSRTSITRAVITGNLNQYTIQSVVNIEEIVLSPTMTEQQRGSVSSKVNVTLEEIVEPSEPWEQISNPVKAGLVYRYNEPFGTSNSVRTGIEIDHNTDPDSAEAQDYYKDDIPARRRLSYVLNNFSGANKFGSMSERTEQDQPKLTEAPQSPMLPFTVGYQGQAFSKKQNIVEATRKLAQQIGQEVQRPEDIPAKNTMGKFLLLTTLLRTMNADEIQQVAGQLYTKEEQGQQAAAWQTYRDAVAQAGTGPSFVTIRNWIQGNKISNEEAADAVATTLYYVRHPTEEYMREFFFTIIQDEQVMAQNYLNESALLGYTHLLHRVCVHKNVSYSRYPVHSFGPFCSERAEQFVVSKVIPYLNQKLQQAVSEADTQKIHAYIRALGNVGHRRILEAFEPYLEGKQQVSQYQRILMVIAMDKLTESNPRVARSVLYKIYQNPSEYEQVRAAAVYQLMRTNPPASMLQRMAAYTNVDPSHYVNSAVQSTIEDASELQGSQHAQLRSAAQSAKHLLTSKQYGEHYSRQHMRHYVVEELKLAYHQQVETFGGEDYLFGKGMKYSLKGHFGGFERQLIDKHGIISSVDDLINVFQQQTEEYKSQQQSKQSQPQHSWSSEHIAEILGMKNEQHEQLEGYLYVFQDALQSILSFDNHTIENLTQVIQEYEQKLKDGESFNYYRMAVNDEAALTFPTALGLPFIYTYDKPTYVKFEGNVKASANPPVSTGKALRTPDHVEAEYEIQAVISRKVQSQFGFFTPFDNQRYSTGYDKNFQVVLPLSGKIQWNVKDHQFYVEHQSAYGEKDIPLLHVSTWPYTATYDIYSPEPEKNIIKSQYPYSINQVIGKKSAGIAFNLQVKSDKRIDLVSFYEKLYQHDPLSFILGPLPTDDIQYTEIDVVVDQQQSSTRKVAIQVGHKYQYQPSTRSRSSQEQNRCQQQFPEDPEKRQEEFIKRVSNGIKNVHAHVADATVIFKDAQEQAQIKYIAAVATAKSDVDPNGSLLAVFKRNDQQGQPLRFCVDVNTNFPNTNGLDLDYAMEIDPTSTVDVKASLTSPDQQPSSVVVNAQFSKSEKRKQYYKEQPEYKECQRQMQEGNRQLPVCAAATARANLLDQFQINVVSQNIDPRIVNYTYNVYSILRHHLYPRFDEDVVVSPSSDSQNVNVQGEFSEDLKYLRLYVNSPYGRVEVKDVEMSEWAQQLLVPHPVFHARSRLMGYFYKYDTYRPICVVDKSAASTFDNRTYPLALGNDWTVLLQYVPRRPQQDEGYHPLPEVLPQQLKKQIESYIVLVRSPQGSSQKELKLVVQSPGTEQKTIEIDLKPGGNSQLPKLYVDQKEVRYSDNQATDLYGEYIQVYALPNNELKLEVQDAFYVIYDGERAKLTAVNSKFRGASRGLCGSFTGEKETDFLDSQYCIWQYPEKVIASYTVAEKNKKPVPVKPPVTPEKCYKKRVQYVDVISAQDKGVANAYATYPLTGMIGKPLDEILPAHKYSRSSCTKVQTQYVVQGDEVCFTLRPLPVCKQNCRPEGTVSKNVSVHCVRQSSASNLWMKQIDKGSSPDFSQKSESMTVKMAVPQSCSP